MARQITGILVCFLFLSCNTNEEKILPVYGDLTEFVYASVKVQPDSLYKVYSTVNGIMDKAFVEEGELVKVGDPILQIVNSNPKLNTQNALLSFKLAQENLSGERTVLDGIEDEMEAARLKLHNDSVHFKRQEKLWEQQIGSQSAYEEKKLAYELSRNRLQLLQNRYRLTRNELETQLKQARNNYETSLINTAEYTIHSKINGKIYAFYKNKGEIVTTQEPLASLGSDSVFVANLLVDEVDIVRLKKGQQVLIQLDAYEGEVFEAVIHKIFPKKDEFNQTFTVEARFRNTPPILYPGLSGEANIFIGRKKNVLSIPRNYLVGDSSVRTEDGLIHVTTGMQNMEMVEITSGISKDTWIYKPIP
ncbi:efflux RND transporter periplasmic adaptor subunit [Gramella sp. KN1008]|uniref:efflux RND transporter periplasmic adaptor subunit n=1 Tax=Gramella sp. KN1008 TaxID=2529298 RepID=UPI00103F567F|nr:efflux RND transporter periplasmic adaptor subunit [Gramella sp. KN1008]TBW26777.1 HlyD family efflux transporter periplasmic adaptor subunit [Gramella sp. KN1008]